MTTTNAPRFELYVQGKLIPNCFIDSVSLDKYKDEFGFCRIIITVSYTNGNTVEYDSSQAELITYGKI